MTEHYHRLAQSALQASAATGILRSFHLNQIPVIALKGVVLRGRVYLCSEQRPMYDIDFLVRQCDFVRAEEALRALGYACSDEGLDLSREFQRQFMGELVYRKESVVVELHQHLIAMSWFRPTTAFDLNTLWSRAIPTEIAGAPALRLCPEDELIHLCYHTAIHHGLTHPHGVRDILGVIRVERNNLDWPTLTARAREWRVSVAVWAALSVTRMLKPEAVPVTVLDALHVPEWRQAVLRPLLRRARAGKPVLISGTMRFLGVLLIDRVRDLPGVVLRGLFPGKRWLQLRYDLSSKQAVWRQFTYPLEVVWRGARAVIGSLIKVA